MRKYETLFLIPGEHPDSLVHGIAQRVSGLIRTHGGEIVLVEDWGRKRLAYPVNKQVRGHYVYIRFLSEIEVIPNLERMLRLDSQVAKFAIVRLGDRLTKEQVDLELSSEARTDVIRKASFAKPPDEFRGDDHGDEPVRGAVAVERTA